MSNRVLKVMRVAIRRISGKPVRPEAEAIDGQEFTFGFGWTMGKAEAYPGEAVWVPRDNNYPKNAPTWLTSGDLQPID